MALFPPFDPTRANVVPTRATDADHVRALLATEGAALVGGLDSEADAAEFARQVLGERLARLGRQFEASQQHHQEESARVADLPADPYGRKKAYTPAGEAMVPHNDGYSFGDFAPDYLFLYCQRPAEPTGGDSFLIDALRLVELLAADPATAALARFCWDSVIDQSEPSSPPYQAPIARLVDGRPQVRNHPYIMARGGPAASDQPLVEQWQQLIQTARDTGPNFRLEAGEMVCADNYRMLHGRHAYDDPARVLYSIWGWTNGSLAVPNETLDISAPAVLTAR